jgi:predicted ATPase/DNA-binding XRE family transcriptional regulator
MKRGASGSFGAHLRALREAAGYTQEELATIAGLSVQAVSALERGERRRPHLETVRALSAALDLNGDARDALIASARAPTHNAAADELSGAWLPLALTALLGREADVHTLRQWLGDPAARLVTIIGPGGVGKTRLALELTRAIADEGPTRVVFVSLVAIRDPGFVGSAIAEALGLANVATLDLPKCARIVCADQPTLLVLDNFEQVLDAAPLVADLLASIAALRVLVTSRAPLRVRGEREYVLGPLALDVDSDAMSPADLARAPAVRLFVERVRDVQPDFRLTSANGSTVTAICRRLDALPLALELAAPWIKALSAEGLLRRLEQNVLLTATGPRDLPERQHSMNATVAWSVQLLAPNEQRVFRRLGALPGRFPIEAAAAVLAGRQASCAGSDEVLSAVAGLIDKSLLLRTETAVPTRPLYQMLETVRAYAVRELTAAGEREDAQEGLARYCSREAALAADGLVGRAQVEWLDRVREDLDSYRRALAWLIDHRHSTEATDIAWGLVFFWIIRGRAVEGLGWYEQILNLPSLPPRVESRARLGAGAMAYSLGKIEPARTALTRARALACDIGDMAIAASAENLLGRVEYSIGHLDAAREHYARSLGRFRAQALAWGVGNALTGLATVHLATGDPISAERLLDEATSALRPVAPWFLALALNVRAVLAVQRGDADDTMAIVRESLTLMRGLHDNHAFVFALGPLAVAAMLKGDEAWAARILGTRDAVTERTHATVVVRQSLDKLTGLGEREVRARLGSDRWAHAYASGRSASIESLLKDIERREHVTSARRVRIIPVTSTSSRR